MASQRVLVIALLGLGVAGGGAWWYFSPKPVVAPPTELATIEEAPIVSTTPQFPVDAIEQAMAGTDELLPELFGSDSFVRDALLTLFGNPNALKLLVSEHLIQRFVGFVDALPGKKLPVAMWPLKPAPGKFKVEGEGDPLFVAAANTQRYDLAVGTFAAVDSNAAVALYVRLYPLLQQAYRELGQGDRYFNDRLVEVIDHLRATPEPQEPLGVLLDEKGNYLYRDSQLESASAGHKFMLRIGAAHRATVKTKLTELRDLLTAQVIPAEQPPAPTPVAPVELLPSETPAAVDSEGPITVPTEE
ncbi:MAG: DUF3014 domain-containing protein [Ahniella sp.]|nr:DUF3014 domain-containing protein [Ahniella sp.]